MSPAGTCRAAESKSAKHFAMRCDASWLRRQASNSQASRRCMVCSSTATSPPGTMSRWSEARGVYDDVCYLRQAHLFQRFWLGGLDTDISRDDDRYLSAKLKEIGFPTWNDAATAPCHTPMPATKKLVMQYPPGTGFVVALFPTGVHVIPLYVLATGIVFGVAL